MEKIKKKIVENEKKLNIFDYVVKLNVNTNQVKVTSS
jgi:hypothetical protein